MKPTLVLANTFVTQEASDTTAHKDLKAKSQSRNPLILALTSPSKKHQNLPVETASRASNDIDRDTCDSNQQSALSTQQHDDVGEVEKAQPSAAQTTDSTVTGANTRRHADATSTSTGGSAVETLDQALVQVGVCLLVFGDMEYMPFG